LLTFLQDDKATLAKWSNTFTDPTGHSAKSYVAWAAQQPHGLPLLASRVQTTLSSKLMPKSKPVPESETAKLIFEQLYDTLPGLSPPVSAGWKKVVFDRLAMEVDKGMMTLKTVEASGSRLTQLAEDVSGGNSTSGTLTGEAKSSITKQVDAVDTSLRELFDEVKEEGQTTIEEMSEKGMKTYSVLPDLVFAVMFAREYTSQV
jgi:hypothetical protein